MKIRKYFSLLLLLIPIMGFAATEIRLGSSDYWPIYSFGNADVTYDVLTAIKGLVASSAFGAALLLFGAIGVFFAAVGAGFDPIRQAPKFFMLIFTVWLVTYSTNQLEATVLIKDVVQGNLPQNSQSSNSGSSSSSSWFEPSTVSAASTSHIITGVPAIVAVPASTISSIGRGMTELIEQFFPTPPELKITSGYFNLSAQILSDATNYKIVNGNLAKNISSYVADCVIPEMGLGRLALTDLYTSNDIWKTLNITNQSLLTRIRPMDSYDSTTATPTQAVSQYVKDNSPFGATVMPCVKSDGSTQDAYDLITAELDKEGILKQTGVEFLGSNQTDLLASYFSSSLNWLTDGQVSGPSYLRQQIMLNQIRGSFRDAAVKLGNNSLITASNTLQAEQQQRSSWSAGIMLFNNTMGYVLSALQVFIMAMTPFVVLALMLPNFGAAVAKNFLQIYVWLALWDPLLSIVNFLVASFSRSSIGPTLISHGLSMANQGSVSDAASNMALAAGFLGTTVPMLSWGLVKGGMAFTEFISHGLGSNFASQAGSATGSGSLNQGGVSLGGVSGNKFDLATSGAVGYGGLQEGRSAGSIMATRDEGGPVLRANNQDLNKKLTYQTSKSVGGRFSIDKAWTKDGAFQTLAAHSWDTAYGTNGTQGHVHSDDKTNAYRSVVSDLGSLRQALSSGKGLTQNESAAISQQLDVLNQKAASAGLEGFGNGIDFRHVESSKNGADRGFSAAEVNSLSQQVEGALTKSRAQENSFGLGSAQKNDDAWQYAVSVGEKAGKTISASTSEAIRSGSSEIQVAGLDSTYSEQVSMNQYSPQMPNVDPSLVNTGSIVNTVQANIGSGEKQVQSHIAASAADVDRSRAGNQAQVDSALSASMKPPTNEAANMRPSSEFNMQNQVQSNIDVTQSDLTTVTSLTKQWDPSLKQDFLHDPVNFARQHPGEFGEIQESLARNGTQFDSRGKLKELFAQATTVYANESPGNRIYTSKDTRDSMGRTVEHFSKGGVNYKGTLGPYNERVTKE